MADTIYLGTGKTVDGKFGTFYNVTISLNKIKDNPQVVEEFKGNKYIFVFLTIYYILFLI